MVIKAMTPIPEGYQVTWCPPKRAKGITSQRMRIRGEQTRLPRPTTKRKPKSGGK